MPLHFDLVSPERLLISEEVTSVVVPGSEGYLTVMENHAPLMAVLKPGVVEVAGPSAAVQRIFVRGGFADISAAGLTILADEAIALEDLDAASFDARIASAEQELASHGGDYQSRVLAEGRLNELRDVRRWILPA